MIEEVDVTEKPSDWPCNAMECALENINNALEMFYKDPSYKNKEVLVGLISDYDLNQRSHIGKWRTTKYEVALINSLFLESSFLCFPSLKTYLYEYVGFKTRTQKMIHYMMI